MPAQVPQAFPRLLEHGRASPVQCGKKPARHAANADERIAAIFRGCQHDGGAPEQTALRSPQVGELQHRAIGADEHDRAGPSQGAFASEVHARTEVRTLLRKQRDAVLLRKAPEQRVANVRRAMQLDAAEIRMQGERYGAFDQPRLEACRALLAEQRNEAGLRAPGLRRFREDDQRYVRRGSRIGAQVRPALRRRNTQGATATSAKPFAARRSAASAARK